jgi:ATP-dependent protease HslVU (ClpYQ) ATPase subunit
MINSFTFFDGYYEAISELNDKDKKDILLAIVEYVFAEKEPNLDGIKNALWVLIKPSLDISKTRSKAKQNKIKTKSNQNQNEIKIKSNQNLCPLLEEEKEIEVEIEDNNSCSSNNNYSAEREKQEQQLQQLFVNCTGSTNLQAISECISYLDDFPLKVITRY